MKFLGGMHSTVLETLEYYSLNFERVICHLCRKFLKNIMSLFYRTTMPNPEDRLSFQRVREDNFDNYHINHHHNFPQEISDTDYPASRF